MARTIEFDRDQVLENAMHTFWRKGYSLTSIPNLVDATSLNPGSIYAAFDSKEGLFLETLEYYGKKSLQAFQVMIAESSSPVNGIENFLTHLVENNSSKNNCGCLVVNTLLEMSSHNKKISETAKKQLEAVENELLLVLEDAQSQNEISKNKDLNVLAKYLMVNIWGLRVLAKTNPETKQTKQIVTQILQTLNA